MAFPQGIDFRRTLGFVSDVSPHDCEPATDAGAGNILAATYPRTSPQGNTVGWESVFSGLNCRDRNAGNDPRIAGLHIPTTAETPVYRIDLDATGSRDIRSACGDASYTCATHLELKDTTTSLGVLSSTDTTGANKFRDATDTEYSAAAWPGSNTAVTKTFATTICRFYVGSGGDCRVAHVYVDATASPSGQQARPVSDLSVGHWRGVYGP